MSYAGTHYQGWQSQSNGRGIQDSVESALADFADTPIRTVCAGRTDTGVHALMQVIHFDAPVDREAFSWVRGTNRFLPSDIAIHWAHPVAASFSARACAQSRRYAYVLLESPVRPGVESGRVGWVFRDLNEDAMRSAARHLTGRHDFSSFRAAECQARTPVKELRRLDIRRKGAYWRFDFEADAFLHHMIRNMMGCLLLVGQGTRPPDWMAEIRDARDRQRAAPTFSADGLYFVGPRYEAQWGLPDRTSAYDWLP